jgi:hypothetical protein
MHLLMACIIDSFTSGALRLRSLTKVRFSLTKVEWNSQCAR